jgi:osmotically-inducible protein OsmY
MFDKQIRDRVEEELDFEPSIDSTNLGVSVHNGVVTLTGHVSDIWQKQAVERAVWRVKGVKALAQEIEVRVAAGKKLSDDAIAERAMKILAWTSSVPRDAVRIKVQGGCVTLTGEVEWHYQRVAAEFAVRRLSGVLAVINLLMLKPRVSPGNLKQRIEQALKRHAEIEASNIEVDVVDGKVSLRGEVEDWSERRAIELAVWAAPGVRSVEDHICIR